MIGQNDIRSLLIEQDAAGVLPHFFAIVGECGSGRKTLINDVFNIENRFVQFADCKISTVREMIAMSYKMSNMYFFMPDIDSMSVGAQNALLKVVEECPNNNYYIVSLEDENNVLETINSRMTVYCMDVYSRQELLEYYDSTGLSTEGGKEIVTQLCSNIGDVNALISYGVEEFYSFVNKVVDNMAEVSLANAMKISTKLAVTKEGSGYDVKLFLRAFMILILQKLQNIVASGEVNDDLLVYSEMYRITQRYNKDLRVRGVNKKFLFDCWLLDIRKSYGTGRTEETN